MKGLLLNNYVFLLKLNIKINQNYEQNNFIRLLFCTTDSRS